VLNLSPDEFGPLGVAAVARIVTHDLGWVFRERPFEDFGVDAHVEIVEDGVISGKLLAIQIKSGPSFFRESSGEGWWYRPSARHVEYWLQYSLPVVIVMYHPETRTCYWQLVRQNVLLQTRPGNWKMLIPKAHVLGRTSRKPLADATRHYESQVVDKAQRPPDGMSDRTSGEAAETAIAAGGSKLWEAAEVAAISVRRNKIAALQVLAKAHGTTETVMHKAIGDSYWVFGGEYITIAPRRDLALLDQHDYPLLRADSSLQIIELKGPAEKLVEKYRNHYIVSVSVHQAVGQCMNYLRALDEQGPTLQTTYRNELGIDIDFRRARGTVVIGYPDYNELPPTAPSKSQIEQTVRSYNSYVSRIQVVTYFELLDSADRVLRFGDNGKE
jgi:hypothetical protein